MITGQPVQTPDQGLVQASFPSEDVQEILCCRSYSCSFRPSRWTGEALYSGNTCFRNLFLFSSSGVKVARDVVALLNLY